MPFLKLRNAQKRDYRFLMKRFAKTGFLKLIVPLAWMLPNPTKAGGGLRTFSFPDNVPVPEAPAKKPVPLLITKALLPASKTSVVGLVG
mgnify:CR=1 FL=1